MAAAKTIVLITGANSGVGFEVANQLLKDSSTHVLLGARSVEKGEAALKDLQSRGLPGTVELLHLDVGVEDSIVAAAKAVESKHGRLDVLINNAGIAQTDGSSVQQMMDSFRINALGPQLMGIYFAPLLRKSTSTSSSSSTGTKPTPRIINVTSGAGSIGNRITPLVTGLRTDVQVEPYRVSKAAMNMVSANQHVEFGAEGFKVFTYCPGHTTSNLGPYNKAEFGAKPVEETAAPIVAMVRGERDAEAGRFLKYGFESFPW